MFHVLREHSFTPSSVLGACEVSRRGLPFISVRAFFPGHARVIAAVRAKGARWFERIEMERVDDGGSFELFIPGRMNAELYCEVPVGDRKAQAIIREWAERGEGWRQRAFAALMDLSPRGLVEHELLAIIDSMLFGAGEIHERTRDLASAWIRTMLAFVASVTDGCALSCAMDSAGPADDPRAIAARRRPSGLARFIADLRAALPPSRNDARDGAASSRIVLRRDDLLVVCVEMSAASDAVSRRCFFHNFSDETHFGFRMGVAEAPGTYVREILNSDSEIYGGANVGNCGGVTVEDVPCDGLPRSIALTLPAFGVVAFDFSSMLPPGHAAFVRPVLSAG